MKILGVDPGLTRCGFGFISSEAGRTVSLLSVGVLQSPADAELASRIGAIGEGLESLLAENRPDVIALERVFSQQNLHSVMGTAQISGVVLYLANRHGIPVAMYTPTEVKAAVSGSGRANKAQVQNMITRILGLTEAPRPADAADALAIAICHAWKGSGSPQGMVAHGAAETRQTPAKTAWLKAESAARRRNA